MQAPRSAGRVRDGGFTLMELLIAVVIVGVISAYAMTSYQSSELKSRRADGKSALANAVQTLERCYTQNFSYLKCGNSTSTPSPATSQRGYYTLSATVSATTYSVRATAVAPGPQAKDTGCTPLTQNSTQSQIQPPTC